MRGLITAIFAVFAAACAASPAKAPRPTEPIVAPVVEATPAPLPGLAVASDCEPAVRAAAAILERGGSAIDAAIAALLVAGVVQPSASGLGGGGVAMVADEKGIVVIDFRPRAPAEVSAAALERARLSLSPELRGHLVAVPGEMAGIAALYRRGGKLSLAELFAPAIALARDGFVASEQLARAATEAEPWLSEEAAVLALARVAPGSRLPGRPALQATLEAIAEAGEAGFYRGIIAEEIVEATAGRLTLDDLEGFEAEGVTAVSTTHGDLEVLTAPFTGGLIVAETLRLLAGPVAADDEGAHRLAEALRLGRADVVRQGHRLDLEALLAPARIDTLRDSIGERASGPGVSTPPGGTTSVLVRKGETVVAIASTIGAPFGARLVTAGGVVLNDQLAAFARPHEAQRLGARPVTASAAVPTSLAPMLVRRGDGVIFALSASGGEHIPGALVQVILALAAGEPPERALSAPRLRVRASGGLWLESEALAPALRARGHHVRTDVPAIEAVQLVGPGVAAVDDRKGGATALRR